MHHRPVIPNSDVAPAIKVFAKRLLLGMDRVDQRLFCKTGCALAHGSFHDDLQMIDRFIFNVTGYDEPTTCRLVRNVFAAYRTDHVIRDLSLSSVCAFQGDIRGQAEHVGNMKRSDEHAERFVAFGVPPFAANWQ